MNATLCQWPRAMLKTSITPTKTGDPICAIRLITSVFRELFKAIPRIRFFAWPTGAEAVAGASVFHGFELLINLPLSRSRSHQAATRFAAAARWLRN